MVDLVRHDGVAGMHTVPANHSIDGTSLLCLLEDSTGKTCNKGKGWRPWLDLEHSTCYNNTNHWSALTDGKMKYIFNACQDCTFPPKEQLFNLTNDPGELVGLHATPSYVESWRGPSPPYRTPCRVYCAMLSVWC